MDKLVLDIPKLQETVAQSGKAIDATKAIGKSVSDSNKKLTSPTTWTGDAANAYKGKAKQWNTNFHEHEKAVSNMRSAMKTVLDQAEALNRQARGFAGIVGARPDDGDKNILTFSPDAKESAAKSCDRAIEQIDILLGLVQKAEDELFGAPRFRLTELPAYRRMLGDRKKKLVCLRQAITKYAIGAETLEATAKRLFGSIGEPEGAIATLTSWGIPPETIADMMKGLNLDSNMYGGDPVNMATGNFVYYKEYLSTKGLYPLSFRMSYNSREKRAGALGPGWTHNFAVSLEKGAEAVALRLEDGREEVFFQNANGTYTQSFNKHDKLRKTAKGFVYRPAGNLSYSFDKDGRNTMISDLNGNSATLAYEQGRLVSVENNSGGALAYRYSPEGNIAEVSDRTGRTVRLSYEGGRVSSATGEEGQEHKYMYDGNGRISGIVDPLGALVLANEYDAEGRITKQSFPDGGATAYDYRDEEKEIRVTEQNGNEVAYARDDRMRSTAAIYADCEERYAYNEQNRRTWKADRNGNETHYGYDGRGNLSLVTNALGETAAVEYNKLNKPTSVAINGVERMACEYDGKGNLVSARDALNRARTLVYNENGQPVRLTQPDGSEVELAYDGRGNVVCVADVGMPGTRYEYDANNLATAATDPNGNKTLFAYNRRGELTKVVDAEGKERSYEYDRAGRLTKATDFDGGTSLYGYDALGRLARFVGPDGQETRWEDDATRGIAKQTAANGAETFFEYDKMRRLVKVTNALGHSVEYEYDPNGNRTCVTDTQGGKTRLAYDALDRVTEVTEADGAKSSFTYNEMGLVSSATDAMGYVRTYAYDAAGQKTEETDPMGNKTAFTYTPLGMVSTVTDPAGRTRTFEYAPGGLLEREVSPDGRWTRYGYDAAKNLVTKQSQSGYALNYSYDSLNRIVGVSSNLGQEKRYSYDALGNVASVTDANGNRTRYEYSATGKLLQVIDALGSKSRYSYDAMGELVQIEQFGPQARATTYHRNLLGQIECVEDALGQSETYSYDALGRVTGKKDKDSYLTQYAYGLNGKLENMEYADGKTVLMSYDPLRRLIGIQDWLGRTAIESDPLGRAVKVTDCNGKEVRYRYGAAGERLETVYPDGKKASYSYDEAVRLRQLTDGDITATYAYDGNGRLCEKQFSNGMGTRYEYNEMGLLSALTSSDREGVLDRYGYSYDLMGNKTAIEKHRRGMEPDSGLYVYGYDAMGRLTDVSKDGKSLRAYTYDAFGNRTGMDEGGKLTNYSFNALGQLMRAEGPDVARDYMHDARGNVTGILENGVAGLAYEFGALNRLEKATNADGLTLLYRYNGLGQRVGRTLAGGPGPELDTGYVLDLTRMYHNLLQSDEGGRAKGYMWDFGVVAERGCEGGRVYLQDELGSPLRFADAGGALVDSYAYDEFGNDLTRNQGAAQPFGYTGYRRDSLAGTYFAQAREYDPSAGRFTARDVAKGAIANPPSLNEYAYCWNRPTAMVDLNGLWPQLAHFADGSGEEAMGAFAYAATEVAGIANAASEKIGSFANAVSEKIGSFANAASERIDGIANSVAGAYAGFKKAAAVFASDICEDVRKFNWRNTSEAAALDSNYFSIYKGMFVVRTNTNRSASFVMMFLTHGEDNWPEGIEDVKHEYGHFIQMQELGILAFAIGIAIPSVTHKPYDYYNQKWEVTADMFGGVGRTDRAIHRTLAAETAGLEYFSKLRRLRYMNGVLPGFMSLSDLSMFRLGSDC